MSDDDRVDPRITALAAREQAAMREAMPAAVLRAALLRNSRLIGPLEDLPLLAAADQPSLSSRLGESVWCAST